MKFTSTDDIFLNKFSTGRTIECGGNKRFVKRWEDSFNKLKSGNYIKNTGTILRTFVYPSSNEIGYNYIWDGETTWKGKWLLFRRGRVL